MSGLVKSVTKKFRRVVKRVKEKKILKTLAAIGAVWFLAGTASAYFAAPEVGLGAAMEASAGSMWGTVSGAGYTSAADIAVTEAAMLPGASQATMLASQNIGLEGADVLTNQALGTAGAGAGSGGVAGAGGTTAGMTNAQLAATMIGGQAVMGAMASRDAEKQREQELALEEERWSRRGTMGFDVQGRRPGPTGIIAAQTQQEPSAQTVSAPEVAAPGQQQVRPIHRKNLPALRKQGLIQQQQVY